MKKNMILMSILAAALLAGCSDNDDKAAIADGTLSCSVNASGAEFVTVWNNGAWKQKEECKGSCNDGVCLSTESTCSGNASECVADVTDLNETKSLLRTCSNGEYRYTNCALLGNKVCGASGDSVACIDNAGSAPKDCVDGLYRCNLAGDREYCSNGKWAKTACPQDQVCSAGECVVEPLVCNEGKKVCDGLVPKVCQNNELIAKPSCDEATQACVAGECVALPKEGDSCVLPNGGVFKSTCSNGTLYECGLGYTNQSSGEVGYLVLKQACDNAKNGTACLNLSSGAVCAYKNDSPLMKEVGPCTAEGEVSFVECDKDARGVDLYAIQCVEADGVLYGKVITPESVCDGNTRISCDSQTGAKVEESCIECNYSSRFEQAQCVTENGGGNNGGGGNGGGGNGGGGNGGPTCDVWNCGLSDSKTLEACKDKGYDSALCFIHEGKLVYDCVNRQSAQDASCASGKTAWEQDGKTLCLIAGEDQACLTGGNGGGGNGGGDDTLYDCSDELFDNNGTTLSQSCVSQHGSDKSVAICAKCNDESFWCVTSEDASRAVGKSAASVGIDAECGGGGATCDVYRCPDINVQGGGTAGEACTAQGYDSALCDSKGYFCANRSEAEDSTCKEGEIAHAYPMEDGTTKTYCEIVGDDASCLTGGGGDNNGGATCDIWNCGLSISAYLEDCKGDGYDSAVCFMHEGKPVYDCLNRQTAQDASCDSGKTAWEQDGETLCLIAGEDQACLTGGGGGATGDDTAYECPNRTLSDGETALEDCEGRNPDKEVLAVLCAECSSAWICVTDERGLSLIGTSLSAALGYDVCD